MADNADSQSVLDFDEKTAVVGGYEVVNVILGMINNQLTLNSRLGLLVVYLGRAEIRNVKGHLIKRVLTDGDNKEHTVLELYGVICEPVDEEHHLEVRAS